MTHPVVIMFKCLTHRSVTSSNQNLKEPGFLVRNNLRLFLLWEAHSVVVEEMKVYQGLKISSTLALQS